jgi:hypothetical protein
MPAFQTFLSVAHMFESSKKLKLGGAMYTTLPEWCINFQTEAWRVRALSEAALFVRPSPNFEIIGQLYRHLLSVPHIFKSSKKQYFRGNGHNPPSVVYQFSDGNVRRVRSSSEAAPMRLDR